MVTLKRIIDICLTAMMILALTGCSLDVMQELLHDESEGPNPEEKAEYRESATTDHEYGTPNLHVETDGEYLVYITEGNAISIAEADNIGTEAASIAIVNPDSFKAYQEDGTATQEDDCLIVKSGEKTRMIYPLEGTDFYFSVSGDSDVISHITVTAAKNNRREPGKPEKPKPPIDIG